MKTVILIFSLIAVAIAPVSIVRAEGGDLTDRPAQMGSVTPPALGNDPRMASLLDANPSVVGGAMDHRARVFEFKGDVRILKAGQDEWVKAEKEMILEAGDQILTGKDSFVDVVYDDHFLNVARIESETKAEFRSIEPTELHLEDGKIFSALDGLAPGDGYRISTPTAVAGVRGTTFDVAHNAKIKLDIINVYPDTTPHLGEVFVEPAESKPHSLTEGQGFSQGKVIEVPEKDLKVAQQFRAAIENNFGTYRQEGFKIFDVSRGDNSKEQKVIGHPDSEDRNDKAFGGPNDGNSGGGGGFDQGLGQQDSDPFLGASKMENPSLPDMETKIDSMLDNALAPPEGFKSTFQGDFRNQEGFRDSNAKTGDSKPSLMGSAGEKNPPLMTKPDMGAMMNFFATGGVSQSSPSDLAGMRTEVDFSGMMSQLGFQPEFAEKFGSQLSNMTSNGMDMTRFISSHDMETMPMLLPGMMTEGMAGFESKMMDPAMMEQNFYQMMDGATGGNETTIDSAMMQTIMQEIIYNPTETVSQEVIQDFLTSNNVSTESQQIILSFLDQLRTQAPSRVFGLLQLDDPAHPFPDTHTFLEHGLSAGYTGNPPALTQTVAEDPNYVIKVNQISNVSPGSTAQVLYQITDTSTSAVVDNGSAYCTSSGCFKP